MKKLEQQDKTKDDIQTTFTSSPTKFVINPTSSFEGEEQADDLCQPKTLMNQKEAAEPQLTKFQEETQLVPISDLMEVDSNVINYGQFICGKILGSTLLLSNVSEEDQIVTMNISQQKVYDCDVIFGQYNRHELPFKYKDGTTIKNSETEFNCWFIENPISKELQKSITLKIGPNMSQEFIIVVKAPKNRIQSRIVSFIDITMTEDQISGTQTGDKQLTRDKDGNVALKEVAPSRKMDVLLLGYLDNPKIKCIKQLFNKQANTEIIPLVVRKTQGVQKFKLPFKNLSQYLDSDIEFAFIRTQNQNGQQKQQLEPIDCLSFYCQPNQLKINAEQVAILGVQVKVNNEMLTDETRVN